MSNPLKKIGKGIKKVFSKVGKFVKKVVKSKAFKIALIAAAVYFGGTALMAAYGGTAAAAGGTAAAAGTAGSTAATTALSTGTIGSAATTVGAGSISPMAAAGGTIGSGAAATTAASAISPMAAAGTATAGSSGILGSIGAGAKTVGSALTTGAKAVGSFAAKHPLITSQVINTGGQMLKGYAEGKALEDERKYQEKLRGQQTIAGVRYDGKGNTTPIDTYQSLNELNKQLFSGVYAQRLTPLYQERNQAQA